MSFTLLSAALLLLLAVGIVPAAIRGYRQGLGRSALSLAVTVLCGLAAIPLAVWLSNDLAVWISEQIYRLVPALQEYSNQFPAVITLLPAILDVLLSAVLFPVLLCFLRLTVGSLAVVLLARLAAPYISDPEDPIYESRLAPWHRRHSRLLGGITGGICGFLVMLALLTPFVGLLSAADTALSSADRIGVKWSDYGMREDHVERIHELTDDSVAAVLEATGCGILFDATANTRLNGEFTVLRDEFDLCADLIADAMASVHVMKDMSRIPPEKRALLAGLGDKINASQVARLVSADVLNQMADAWSRGYTFMKVPCPRFNEHLEPLVGGLLKVCADATPDCVGRDISTVMNICLIASDSGMMTGTLTYAELAASLDQGGVIDRIYNEILDNPCTAPMAGNMTEIAIRMMATALDSSGMDPSEMKGLMTHLSDAFNRVRSMGISNTERVSRMKEYTAYYAKMYGLSVPDSLAEVASVAVMERLSKTTGRVSAEQFYGLFEAYMKK